MQELSIRKRTFWIYKHRTAYLVFSRVIIGFISLKIYSKIGDLFNRVSTARPIKNVR